MNAIKSLAAAAAAATFAISGAHAAVSFGGYDIEAFADTVVADAGAVYEKGDTDSFDRDAVTAAEALLGFDLGSSSINYSGTGMIVAFNDVTVVNGAGADLVIFELFSSSEFGDITINGFTQAMSGVSLGLVAIPGSSFSNAVHVAEIDLSDFGYALGQSISMLTLNVSGNSSEYAGFGALSVSAQAIPVPAAAPLMLAGLGLMSLRRKLRRA